MPRHERVTENPKTGWSDWISPVMRRYQMACCDCGLVHTMRLRILRVTRHLGRGRWRGVIVPGHRVQFQAQRNERATSAVRRRRPKRRRATA